jgi:hypothetical protein
MLQEMALAVHSGIRTVPELRKSLGYAEGGSLRFFGDARIRHRGQSFTRLASAGAFEVLLWPSEEEEISPTVLAVFSHCLGKEVRFTKILLRTAKTYEEGET